MGKITKQKGVTSGRTAPKLLTDCESNVTIHPADEGQIQALYGINTKEAADLLLRFALNAFGKNGMKYSELMPAMDVEMEPRDANDGHTFRTAIHVLEEPPCGYARTA